jgi:transcriptional regulator with XRE-family HTH domain
MKHRTGQFALQEKNSSVYKTKSLGSQPMASIKQISLLIKAKRRQNDNQPLRDAATQAKISAATLSRLERGLSPTLPDATTLNKLARWLGVPVSELLEEKQGRSMSSVLESTIPEFLEVHLRADKNLSPKTAKALAEMFKALYEHSTTGKTKK